MSDVRIYAFTPADFGAIGDGVTDCTEAFQKAGHYVRANDYHESQSQLAALREELAEIKESTAYRGSLLGRTERRLGEAERRNKLLENILRNGRHLGGAGWKITVEAALNPKPEAASHE